MSEVATQFLSIGTVLIAAMVVIVGFFVRRTVETIWPGLKPLAHEMESKAMYGSKLALWYNQVFLYLLPVLIGVSIGFLNEPYLFNADIKTGAGRVFYSAVVGWFADFLYEIVQKALLKTTGVELPSADPSEPPGSDIPKHHHDHDHD